MLSYQTADGAIVDLRCVEFADNDGKLWRCNAGYQAETGYVFTQKWEVEK